MRSIIVFCILFLTVNLSQGQSLINSDLKWERHELTIDSTQKRSIISGLDHWLIGFLKTYPFNYLDDPETMSRFHFVDYSGDSQHDILYEGSAGAEGTTTILLRKTQSGFVQDLAISGTLAEYYQPFANSAAILKFLEFGCCQEIGFVSLYYPKNSPSFGYSCKKKVSVHSDLSFPDKYDIKIRFKTTNPTYTLRLNPFIPSEKGVENDNVVSVYPEGSEGIAISREIDSTGRVWWFVLMDNNKGFTSSFYYNDLSNNEFYQAGWMSSRYLEEL